MTHTSDATFRAWGSELSAALATVGLVQTSDTGQINWTTVARPAINTMAGYEIWRFNDTLQSTAPIYFKLEYGTSGTATIPAMYLTVGTGSDGAGTITGTAATARTLITHTTNMSGTAAPSYLCCVEGFLGLVHKIGANTVSSMANSAFFIHRSTDSAGALTATGAKVLFFRTSTSTMNGQSLRFASPAAAYTVSDTHGIFPENPTSGVSGTDTQLLALFGRNPAIWTMTMMAGVGASDFPVGATFSAAMVGATSRTFVIPGGLQRPLLAGTGGGGSLSSYTLAMVWE